VNLIVFHPPLTATSSLETRSFGMSTTSVQSVRQAYRLLYKAGLAAVQYSVPNRYCVRDKLRKAFRSAPASQYNQRRIDNTIQFLWTAAEKRGMEHKIVKNLCLVHYYQIAYRKKRFVYYLRTPQSRQITPPVPQTGPPRPGCRGDCVQQLPRKPGTDEREHGPGSAIV
jgi:hypothetical protein